MMRLGLELNLGFGLGVELNERPCVSQPQSCVHDQKVLNFTPFKISSFKTLNKTVRITAFNVHIVKYINYFIKNQLLINSDLLLTSIIDLFVNSDVMLNLAFNSMHCGPSRVIQDF